MDILTYLFLQIINGFDWEPEFNVNKNYKTGKRNRQRVVYSNDGLIFVTFDHYVTFFEII